MSSRPPGSLAGQAASLGPHVVGERVVVRRLLRGETGPTGGPAFTDLLGTCLSWGDGECVVAPESGEPVRIALADIVSGKPVPPRPSVRHRVPTREAEVRGLRMFPGTHTEPLGEWLLRTDPASVGRLYKRANSCLAIGDPGVPIEAEGRAVLDGDWLGVHELKVRLEHRRRGLARDVVATLLEWGAERGALTAWLHVESDNHPARALYDSLGLGVHHTVRYLSPTGRFDG